MIVLTKKAPTTMTVTVQRIADHYAVGARDKQGEEIVKVAHSIIGVKRIVTGLVHDFFTAERSLQNTANLLLSKAPKYLTKSFAEELSNVERKHNSDKTSESRTSVSD